MHTPAYAALSAGAPLQPLAIARRAPRPHDVVIDILYCGVCHSDLHQVRNDWGGARYPMVPGHEIIGRVAAVGSAVAGLKVGDPVGVGCMVDSCQACDQCGHGEEQFCRQGPTMTYNGRDRLSGETTQGGYSRRIVVHEAFAIGLSPALDLARAAPLLCAGITTWSPLRQHRAGPGTRLGVVGLGGLGHMAVKLGVALGCEVTLVTGSAAKADDALALGAHRVLLSRDAVAMKAAAASMDLIIDTVPVAHDLDPYVRLLDVAGQLVVVGALESMPVNAASLMRGRRQVSGSLIGGIAQTRELLAFCAEREVYPACESIPIQQIDEAFARMERADVKYRFVIDMASLADA
ncbi:NAD(P)-dependent alcohol dehydrogenase [Stenotrophomonas mori]|uniref:NAD(P)-dependent alcohol dehydrogenase n=1 Tax=Stenotrophomonas mori TaxID=2871096 RepID=A0ABT0SGU5_9GAMM|nr:NAD(P)-dependent alcohol dehydrogenase [Stenotrophomonas mori]MCL7714550.1 NAD(P)-dependent alcohol dehydrogenase [Stenotrophomonas mori]